jgi:FkbM family methyltransferase
VAAKHKTEIQRNMGKLFSKLLKNLFDPKKNDFDLICKANNLVLDYNNNKKEIDILREVFEARSYSDYFPFYQKVTIIDIGAHYGYFSLFSSKNTNSATLIFAFEPDISNYRALCSNIEKNNAANIRPVNCAIAGTKETSRLYKGKSPNNSLMQNYSLVQKDKYTEIQTTTLSQIIYDYSIKQIDFLKMDCEGSEYAILETMPDEVFNLIKTVSMEFHDLKNDQYNGQFIVDLLRKHCFEIVRFTYNSTSMGLNYGRIIATKFK